LERHIIQTCETVLINDHAEERVAEFGMKVTPGTEFTKSLVFVPMIVADKVRGMVSLQNVDKENAFSESDVRLLQTLANSMSVAIENARLFDETQSLLKETEQRAAELAIINSVQQGVSSNLDFQTIIDLVGDKLREIFKTGDIPSIVRRQGTGMECTFMNMASLDPAAAKQAVSKAPPKMIETTAIVVNTQAESIDMFGPAIPGTDKSKSMVRVPIIGSDRIVGSISIENSSAIGFSESTCACCNRRLIDGRFENARPFDETSARSESEQRAEL
jgi:GAF domain-containing protein